MALGTITYSGSATGWLSASLSGSATPATVTLVASPVPLAAGTYTAQVPVTATGTTPQAISVTFAVSAQAATQLAITAQPSASASSGAPFGAQPVVEVRDAGGVKVAGATNAVTASILSGSGTLVGTTTVSAVNGVATFTNLQINGAAGGYTLAFAASGLASATSATIALTQTASQLVLTTQPAGAVTGTVFTTQPVVEIQDAGGVRVASATNAVSVATASGPGTLSGTLTVNATGGVATFTNLKITGAGTSSLSFTAGGLTATTSTSFAVTQVATQLAITTQPSASASSGVAFGTQPVVEVRDGSGTKVLGSTNAVTAAIASGTGTLVGTTTVNAVNGVASFTNLQINGTGAHTLTFTSAGLASATSSTVTVTQTATQLVITTQPAGASSGTVFGTQPVVEIRDAMGTKVAGATNAVTAAIASGTGTLVGTTTVNAVNGVVTFTDLKINGVGTSSLSFTATGLTSATSISFAVTQVPTQLALVTAPSATAASGVALATQPALEVRDVGGTKVAGSTVNVTAAIASGTATLGGTTTVAAVNGTATFTNLLLTGATGSVTLTFTSSGLTAATSGTIALTQTASQLAITTQPSATASSGAPFATQPVVAVRDPGNLLVANSTVAVTAAVASGTGTLSGTTTVNAVGGVATFTNLKINGSGAHTLSFTATGLTSATSSTVTVTQAATQLAITTQPSASASSGSAFGTQPVVEIRDGSGTKVAGATNAVTAAIASGSGALVGTTTVNAVNGVATFTNLQINGSGAHTLSFTATGLTSATSNTVTVTQTATQLVITTQPAGASSGTVFGTQPVVEIRDASGTKVVGATNAVTAAIATGSGTLVGTTTVNAVNGVVTFTDLKINGVGSSSLSFTAPGLTPATSISFAVTQVPTQLALVTAPSATAASGVVLATQPVVEVRDVGGTKVAGSTVNVTAAIASGTATLGGTTTVAAVNGTATFTNLTLTGATGSVTLTFTSSGLTAATSGTIALTQTASQLVLTTQPAGAVSGVAFTTQPVVAVRDPGNLLVANSTVAVTAAVASGTGTLSGTTTVNAVGGVATFTNLKISGGGAHTLTFTATGLTAATSTSFTLTQTATQLAITTQPSASASSGSAFGTQPVVEIRDGSGTKVTGATNAVTAAIATGTGTLVGTTTVNAVNGVATFTNLQINGSGAHTLSFTASGLTSATSSTVTVTQTATQLAITTQPAGASSGTVFGTQPVVEIRDVSGTKVAASTVAVTAAIASGGGTLAGTTTVNAVGGVATFSDLKINGAVGNYTLIFTSSGLTSATSVIFAVTQVPTQLALVTAPSAAVASGVAFPTQPVVEVRDVGGTKVAGSTVNVTAAIASGTATLGGTTTVAAVNGTASFSNLKLTGATGNVTLTFTSSGLTAATSGTIALTQTASQLVLTTQPAGAVSGAAFTTQPVVEIRDPGNLLVANSTVAVTAAVATGTGTLVGTTTVNAVNGVATFTNLQINGSGAHTLSFTATGLTAATSSTVTVTQAATQLAITTQPSASASSGTVFATQPVVEIRDGSGTKVAGATNAVTAAIASGTGTLAGTTTVNAVNGVATFTNLKINGSGAHTLSFTATGLTSATSSTVTVTQTATQLAITTQPSANASSGSVFGTQPVVEIRDGSGTKVAGATNAVTAAIASGTGTLVGTTTVNAVNGVATFTNLQINGTAGSFTLSFSATALTSATSNTIALTQTATQLAISTQPSGAATGTVFTTQPVIEIRDAGGVKVATATSAVTAAVASGPGTLSGTLTVNAVGGVATFTDLKITGAGTSSLTFTATALTSATSGTFAVSPPVITLDVGASASTPGTNGQNITIPLILDLTQAGGQNIASFTTTVTWDPTKFNYVSVSAGTSGWAAVPNTTNTASGTLSLSMFDAIGLSSGTTTMYNVTLVPKASGTTSVSAGVSAAGADIGTNILPYMATRSLTVVVP
jgi:hypothetical protein